MSNVRRREVQILKNLIYRWQSEGLVLFAPETEDAVRQAFASVGSLATADVVSLYAAMGGMEEMDKEYWRLWPLVEVRAENTEHSPFGVLFSDYLMNCCCYRLKPNSADTSSVLVDYFDGREPIVVAHTLGEFLEAYAVNPTLLLDVQSLARVRSSDA